MRRLVFVLLLGCAGAVSVAVLVLRAGGDEPAPAAVSIDLESCRNLLPDASRDCWTREFLAAVEGRDDPRPAVAAIADAAWREGGFLLSSCHGLMHTVGRTYAREAGITLAKLMDYLPRSNDPGCSAGFAHGLVTGVAPQIEPRRPARRRQSAQRPARAISATAACTASGTRSCGSNNDSSRRRCALCRALGPAPAPDCAQGAYHDYWFAVDGADDASLPDGAVTDPRELCGAQPAAFVRPCWYRAFVETGPRGSWSTHREHLDVLCGGLDGLQRQACVTGASGDRPAPTRAAQLELCAGLQDPSDAAGCIRGTKAQNLLGSPASRLRPADRRTASSSPARRGPRCYRWLGKAIARAHRRRVRADGLPEARGSRRAAQLPRRRAHDGRRARHVQLTGFGRRSGDAVCTCLQQGFTLRLCSAC